MKKICIISTLLLMATFFNVANAITIKWKMAAGSTIPDCVMYCWTGGTPNVEPAGTWNAPNTAAFTTEGDYTVFTTSETHLAGVIFHKSGVEGQSPTIADVNSDLTVEVLYNGTWSIIGGSSLTIKFKNEYGWSQVYGYAWEGGNHPLGDWPGTPLTLGGDDWYTVEIPGSLISIMFRGSSNSEQSTQILDLTHDTCVGISAASYADFISNGLYTLYSADCNTGNIVGPTTPNDDVTIRWKKSSEIDWADMGIYEWSQGGGHLCDAWPGIQVMPNEDGWYEYTFSETPEHIIFNNFIATQELGGKQVNGPISQTSDICVEIHTAYYCIADCETGEAPCSELEHFTVKWNNAQGWADMSIYAWIGEEGITELFGAYPGEIVTADEFGVYSKTFVKATPVNMIFISPTDFQQSSNIMGVYDDICYNITSEIEYNELLEETFVCESIDCSTIATANTTLVKEDLQIMPNPATEKLYIQGNNKIQSITIYTVNGDKMSSLVGNHSSIDVSKLPKGSYLIQVKAETSTIVKKFVKN